MQRLGVVAAGLCAREFEAITLRGTKSLRTFPGILKAFRSAVSFRFVGYFSRNADLFAAYNASLGIVSG
jgi:hypothetical protein